MKNRSFSLMVRFGQFVLSLLPLSSWNGDTTEIVTTTTSRPYPVARPPPPSSPKYSENVAKSIAIVGAGSAGIAVLKTLVELPQSGAESWRIVLFEQRRDVGGVWLADPEEPHPPTLPETPLYPLLHINTPHPTMTYPGYPFPPNTPLFPSHEYVQKYHFDVARQLNLTQYIKLNHEVYAAGWIGNSTHGKWEVEIHALDDRTGIKSVFKDSFDHLIVASGHNHYPRVPEFNGTEEWLANSPPGGPRREFFHSVFYRTPDKYTNKTVVVVGGGASGRDVVTQIGSTARKVYHSVKPKGKLPSTDPTPHVGQPVAAVSHFTKDAIVLQDNTSLLSVDSVILATGYQFLIPLLSRSPRPDTAPVLTVSPETPYTSDTAPSLQSNTRYIYPLHEHIFSLSPAYPPTSLSFVGLPVLIANCPSDIAQSLLVAHALADPDILPARSEMLSRLLEQEASLKERGYDPYAVGHKMVGGDGDAQAYQNALVRYLKAKGRLPDDGKDYVEQWRKEARNGSALLRRAWTRIEGEGEREVRKWLDGVETEEEWADMMSRMYEWQQKWEDENGYSITGTQNIDTPRSSSGSS